MKSLRISNGRAGYLLSAVALLVATVAPSLVLSSDVYAGTISSRSMQLSSSAAGNTPTTYNLTFTPADATGATASAVIIDFCSNSPIAGQTCTAPTGFDASSATISTSGYTISSATSLLKISKTSGDITNGANTLTINVIKNPTSVTTSTTGFYARILTYDLASGMTGYTSTSVGSPLDTGGIAMAIVNQIGVTAAVLETMTFCVSGTNIGALASAAGKDCTGADSPNLTLGETSGSVKALSPSAVSSGTVYAQISTNAATGAIVNMKSSTTSCGGLVRAGAANCDITPAAADIVAGTAKFGVKTGTAAATTGLSSATGAFQAAGSYNASTYYMNYVAGNATGVTSTYGDPFLNTNSLPVNNMNIPITFGASISNNTPAGLYSASISMIATGTY